MWSDKNLFKIQRKHVPGACVAAGVRAAAASVVLFCARHCRPVGFSCFVVARAAAAAPGSEPGTSVECSSSSWQQQDWDFFHTLSSGESHVSLCLK